MKSCGWYFCLVSFIIFEILLLLHVAVFCLFSFLNNTYFILMYHHLPILWLIDYMCWYWAVTNNAL